MVFGRPSMWCLLTYVAAEGDLSGYWRTWFVWAATELMLNHYLVVVGFDIFSVFRLVFCVTSVFYLSSTCSIYLQFLYFPAKPLLGFSTIFPLVPLSFSLFY